MASRRRVGGLASASVKGALGISTRHAQPRPWGMLVVPVGRVSSAMASRIACLVFCSGVTPWSRQGRHSLPQTAPLHLSEPGTGSPSAPIGCHPFQSPAAADSSPSTTSVSSLASPSSR
jgi:hypothetical protein